MLVVKRNERNTPETQTRYVMVSQVSEAEKAWIDALCAGAPTKRRDFTAAAVEEWTSKSGERYKESRGKKRRFADLVTKNKLPK